MNRAAALLALLALAACGGAGSAPEAAAKGVDVDAELAALRSTTPSQRDAAFWAAEGAQLTTLWARALPICSEVARAYYENNGPKLPNCAALLHASQRLHAPHLADWQQRYNYLGSAPFFDRNIPIAPPQRELIDALNSSVVHPVFSNVAFWREHAATDGPLWPIAFQHCSKTGTPGINPSCVAVLSAAGNFYKEYVTEFLSGERRKPGPR